ncbi:MAG: tetratricopeptide repeat protein [Myxococcota bacterium]
MHAGPGWSRASLLLSFVISACPPANTGPEPSETSGDEIMFPDEAERRDAESSAPPASAEVRQAESLLARGEAEEALSVLEQAVAGNPADPRAQLDLGLAYEMTNDSRRAEAAYRAAIEASPEFPEAHNNLGLLLRNLERYDEAAAALREAVRLRSDYASAHVNLALTLEEAGDRTAAVEAYRLAVRFAPRDALSRINLGLLLLEEGNEAQAAIELRRGLPLAQGDPAALQAVGNGLRRAGQPEAAARAMRLAVEAVGDEVTPALLAELALALRAANAREEAEATLERALELDPSYATAHYLLGNMRAGRGAFDEAIGHYRQYLRLAPDGPHAEIARERLERARAAR